MAQIPQDGGRHTTAGGIYLFVVDLRLLFVCSPPGFTPGGDDHLHQQFGRRMAFWWLGRVAPEHVIQVHRPPSPDELLQIVPTLDVVVVWEDILEIVEGDLLPIVLAQDLIDAREPAVEPSECLLRPVTGLDVPLFDTVYFPVPKKAFFCLC